ncbi:MAG: hypothetical protein OHK93_006744 [Ramalina farinacea]|uniref:Uncharacterized protein n=1 Tax=Ramalina farinacea TaxID=258253 RepID=A0AA43QLF1_9LECA|nr:hypothetical protein [Ramalina farinacea]
MDAPMEAPMDTSMEFEMEAPLDTSMDFAMDAQTAISLRDMNAPIYDYLEDLRSNIHRGEPRNPEPQTLGIRLRREDREPHDYDDKAFDKEGRLLMKKHNPEVMAASKRLDNVLGLTNYSRLHVPRSDPSVTPAIVQRNRATIEAAMVACGNFGLPALKRVPGSQHPNHGIYIRHDRTRLEYQPGSLTERLCEAVHLRAKPVLKLDLCDVWGVFKEAHLHTFMVDFDGVEAIIHGQASFSGAATSAENEQTCERIFALFPAYSIAEYI